MNRLYNEYGSCPAGGDSDLIVAVITPAVEKIWNDVVITKNICPRDVTSFCHEYISVLFSEKILIKAFKDKKDKIKQ